MALVRKGMGATRSVFVDWNYFLLSMSKDIGQQDIFVRHDMLSQRKKSRMIAMETKRRFVELSIGIEI